MPDHQSPTAPAHPEARGIRAEGVSKRFGEREVLSGVDLAVPGGELHVLLGLNGAGKSTLLRIFSTTLLAEAGRATVFGLDVVRDAREVRRTVGLCLSDERSWYWPLTGLQNLEFFARLHGLRKTERLERCQATLDQVGLSRADADRSFNEYSTGMRLRLSIARAILHEPRALLLDEPTRSLDPIGKAETLALLREQASNHGRAVLLVSHDVVEADEADQAGVLRDGRIVARFGPNSGADIERFLGLAS